MLTVRCECGALIERIDWYEPAWGDMWKEHGHFPSRCTMICPCGSECETGPEVWPDPQKAVEADGRWWDLHEQHCRVN
jgi:hypothetical protein